MKKTTRLHLKKEYLRILSGAQLARPRGGMMCDYTTKDSGSDSERCAPTDPCGGE